MEKNYLRFVIIGHVDHGKSTLIGRLLLETNSLSREKIAEVKRASREFGRDTQLAFLTDQLKEERADLMTLDTTQIFFRSRGRNYAIIDAPGHAELIKNMITGASIAQAAVLIIDTHEGIMEQTRRHASIIGLLGISKLIVLLNKMDLVGYAEKPFNETKDRILAFLDNLGIKPAAVIPVSAKAGANVSRSSSLMRWYKGPSFLTALDSLRPATQDNKKTLRLPIQDVYEINGEKIIVGKILSGKVLQGQGIKLLPSGKKTKIALVKAFGKALKKAHALENVGIVLEDALPAKRGEIIVDGAFAPGLTNRFKAELFWISKQPLRTHRPMLFRCSTQEVQCVVEKIEKRIDSSTLEVIEENASELKMNETGIVTLKTEDPVCIEKFSFLEGLGRFVLERGFDPEGAGIII